MKGPIRVKILVFLLKVWWGSWWGQAIIHASFDKYKNSIIFQERCKYFSPTFATKLFKWRDFKLFRRKVLRDKKLMFTILFRPVTMCKKLRENNWVLKKEVNLKD